MEEKAILSPMWAIGKDTRLNVRAINMLKTTFLKCAVLLINLLASGAVHAGATTHIRLL
jgi:hypothetical protein